MRRALALVVLAASSSNCTFVNLKRDVARAAKTAYVSGALEGDLDPAAPMFLVHLVGEKKRAIQRLTPVLPEFVLLMKLGEQNSIEAFQDLDGDEIYDPGEPCAFVPRVEGLESFGVAPLDLEPLKLERTCALPVTLDLSRARPSQGGTVGEVVPLSDPRYDEERVSEGVWTPLRATTKGGYGLHFLEAHKPGRLPVLFIHGISGSPRNFSELVEHVDRTKFEPWVAYYPSGVRLPVLSQILAGLLVRAKETYGVERVFIVAHSMGGLIARAAIQHLADRGEAQLVAGLLTLATPWGGHASAGVALDRAPEAVPSWIDIAPDSRFLKSLEKPLPPGIPFFLFFTVGGRTSRYDENNDGVVFVQSELVRWAQDQATKVVGFDEGHMSLLKSAEVEAKLWPLVK